MVLQRLLLVVTVLITAGLAYGQGTGAYRIIETESGVWNLFISVSGKTSGLVGFTMDVKGISPAEVAATSFDFNPALTTTTTDGTVGFAVQLSGGIADDEFFNFVGHQSLLHPVAIYDVGMIPVFVESIAPSLIPSIDLDVPTFLGTLRSSSALIADNFGIEFAHSSSVALYDQSRTARGFLSAEKTTATLEVIPIGDATDDGIVDGADLVAVQTNYGAIARAQSLDSPRNPGSGLPQEVLQEIAATNVTAELLSGDANHDRQVSGQDLITVQQNFGVDTNPSSASVPIPEPATFVVLAFGYLTFLAVRRSFPAFGSPHHF